MKTSFASWLSWLLMVALLLVESVWMWPLSIIWFWGRKMGLTASVVVGVLRDLILGSPVIGESSVLLLVVCLGASLTSKWIDWEKPGFAEVLCGICLASFLVANPIFSWEWVLIGMISIFLIRRSSE